MVNIDVCDNCPYYKEGMCKRDKDNQIIQECQSLEPQDRIIYASENKLFKQDIKKTFSEIFWTDQDYKGQKLMLDILKIHFDKPKRHFKKGFRDFAKDQLYLELIMKFCKLAEDLGALLASKDQDIFKFTQKYLNYSVGTVVNFYSKLPENKKDLGKLFFYPDLEKQKSENFKVILEDSLNQLKDNLEFIKIMYLNLRKVYNSYKHGYRIRVENTIGEYKGKKFNKSIVYYDSKSLMKNPFYIPSLMYQFSDDSFNILFYKCISILILIEIFIKNYFISNLPTYINKIFKIFVEPENSQCYEKNKILDFLSVIPAYFIYDKRLVD